MAAWKCQAHLFEVGLYMVSSKKFQALVLTSNDHEMIEIDDSDNDDIIIIIENG